MCQCNCAERVSTKQKFKLLQFTVFKTLFTSVGIVSYKRNLVIGLFKIYSVLISELVWIFVNCLRKKVQRKKRKNISEATIHFNSDMSKSILSFFKKSDTNSGSNVESVNNPDDAILPRKENL